MCNLASRDAYIKVFPYNASFEELSAWNPNGYFLSNGPGDPEPLKEAQELAKKIIAKNLPLFGICLGMQLMCNFSEEGNTECLKIFSTEVKKFDSSLKVPQIGWNTISNLKDQLFNNISENEYMYLVHSYYVPLINETTAEVEPAYQVQVLLENS